MRKQGSRSAFLLLATLLAIGVGLAVVFREKNAVDVSRPSQSSAENIKAGAPPGRIDAAAQSNRQQWYSQSFADVVASANNGDALAQRQLSEFYEDCLGYSLDPDKYLAGLDVIVGHSSKGGADAASRVKQVFRARCDGVDGGKVIPIEASRLWLQQSASSGDVVSKIRLMAVTSLTANKSLSGDEVADLLSKVREQKSPEAVFEVGRLIPAVTEYPSDARIAPLLQGPYAQYAWEVAACRAGYACSADSRIMFGMCVNSGACNFSSYDQLVLSDAVPQGDRQRFEQQVEAITDYFLRK